MTAVAFDIGPLFEANWTGIPVFTARLARCLLAQPDLEPVFVHGGEAVETEAVRRALALSTGIYLRADYERRRALREDLPRRIQAAISPTVKTRIGAAEREASVVHDMSTVVTPEFHTIENIAFHRRHLMGEVLTNDVTFAVSDATADDVVRICGVPRERVRTALQYVDWPDDFEARFRSRYDGIAPPPFVAILGTIEPRKNLRLVIAALDEVLSLDPALQLVVIGKRGWHLESALGSALEPWLASGRLHFTGFVSEFEKYCYLRLCRFMVFPSLFEGFGIPVLEAMSVGKPVLASWSSSIPEVGGEGEAAIYFDPLSRRDFIERFAEMYDAVEDGAAALEEAARAQAARFTPERFFAPVREWLDAG